MNWVYYMGCLVLVAGHSAKKSYWVYDLRAQELAKQGQINQERYWHGVTRCGPRIFAVLGQGGPNSIEEYDFKTDTWEDFEVVVTDARLSDTMALGYKDRIFITIYGHSNVYSCSTITWTVDSHSIDNKEPSVYRMMLIHEKQLFVVSNNMYYGMDADDLVYKAENFTELPQPIDTTYIKSAGVYRNGKWYFVNYNGQFFELDTVPSIPVPKKIQESDFKSD
jgi:hypothetical protein